MLFYLFLVSCIFFCIFLAEAVAFYALKRSFWTGAECAGEKLFSGLRFYPLPAFPFLKHSACAFYEAPRMDFCLWKPVRACWFLNSEVASSVVLFVGGILILPTRMKKKRVLAFGCLLTWWFVPAPLFFVARFYLPSTCFWHLLPKWPFRLGLSLDILCMIENKYSYSRLNSQEKKSRRL